MKSQINGGVWITLLTLMAYLFSFITPSSLNSILLALIFGVIIGNSVKFSEHNSSVFRTTGNLSLEFSIVFLAFGINYSFILALGLKSIVAIVFVVFTLLLFTFYLAKKLKCPDSTAWLIGFGTAICGSSAIAAASPIITKNKEDVGISLAVVNLYGAIGMLLFPVFFNYFNFTNEDASFIIGGSLHSVGNVLGAGYALSDEIGQTSLTVKMARVALLSPALLFIILKFKNNGENTNTTKMIQIPWYLIAFIVISSLVSLVPFPEIIIEWSEVMGKLALTIALAAIGLNIKLKTLINSGKKGLLFGLIIFIIQLALLGIFILYFFLLSCDLSHFLIEIHSRTSLKI
jgi:uncharacterized integral membrane protein (TIGR00698 family)